jgi:hypothetical protein
VPVFDKFAKGIVTDCTDVGRRPPRQINHDSLGTQWLTACYQEAGAERGDNRPNAFHHSNPTQPLPRVWSAQ